MPRRLLAGTVLAAALAGAAAAGAPQSVATAQLELEFRDGWLTRWRNKLTDEELRFDAGAPVAAARGSEFLKFDESAAALTQSGAAGWALRVKTGQAQLLHAAAGPLAQRYVLLQGNSGGLLLLLDDPALERAAALERDAGRGGTTLTWRADAPANAPPVRWLLRQYIGGANWGAQHWLDYLARTQAIPPPDRRPTAWARGIACVVADPPWCRPAADPAASWDQSLALHRLWLDRLARVVDPDKVLFVAGQWADANGAPAPYAALLAGAARRLGYHLALRLPPWTPGDGRTADGDRQRGACLGAALAAARALGADALLVSFAPAGAPAAQRDWLQRLRRLLDQDGLIQVALGVAGEASEAALPLVDFQGGGAAASAFFARGLEVPAPADAAALAALLPAQAPLPVRLPPAALLTAADYQACGLPPPAAGPACTRFLYDTLALARCWSELQPRLLEPKYFAAGDLARFRLTDGRVLRLTAAGPGTLRYAWADGGVLAELNAPAGWTNNAALRGRYAPLLLDELLAQ